MKLKRAFSLIELSIVILIIGILVAGVTQSSRLIREFRLSTAKNLTQNSPVSSISGLILWLESVGEKSFISSEAEENGQVTTWYDTNPQSGTRNNATRASASTSILYKEKAINSLPALYFSGVGSTTAHLVGNVMQTPSNAFTLVLVLENNDSGTGDWRPAFRNGVGANGWAYQKAAGTKNDLVFPGVVDSYSTSDATTNPEIVVATYNGSTMDLYINGVDEGPSTTSSTPINPVSQYMIGNSGTTAGTSPWFGYIAEIIVFDRALKNEERTSIQDYLSKKWGIVI